MHTTYLMGSQELLETLLEQAGQIYTLREKSRRVLVESYYDTYDWRLYEKGWILYRRGKALTLSHLDYEKNLTGKGPQQKIFFPEGCEDGELHDELRAVADIRALIRLAEVRSSGKVWDLLNGDGKTVVRLRLDVYACHGERAAEPLTALTLCPLRGYEKPAARVKMLIDGIGVIPFCSRRDLFEKLMRQADRTPCDYCSKYDLSLSDESTLRVAVCKICRYLALAMECNVDGAIADIDSEFLHDFRVAIRRTRSLLSQLKKDIPEEVKVFYEELRWLGCLTGPVRDLDVYLLGRKSYQEMVPEDLQEGISLFFEDLIRRRQERRKEMVQGLTSKRYRIFMEQWSSFFAENNGQCAWVRGDLLCRDVARKRIGKRFAAIIRRGAAIDQHSADEALHRLRIHCKKLRYLLEFFRSFYDQEELKFFLGQMKKLQNNLGEFNDISVQMSMLVDFRDGLSGRNKRSIKIAASIGGLLAELARRHGKIRRRYDETFAEFASKDTVRRFKELLQ